MSRSKRSLLNSLKRQYLIRSSLPIFLVIILIFSCAKVEGPSGGPEDKTPPKVVGVSPSDGMVDVPVNLNKIEITFSKSMNKTATQNAVFISPLFFDYPQYKWKGKKLEVELPEMLRTNTTYVLTIGASAQDSKRNQLGETNTFAFSTGQTIYDGIITGKVFSDNSRNMYIWAYKLADADPDTFWMKVPDYVTQPDSLGKFSFEYLSYGHYLVVAAQDKNNNQFWEPPGDKLGLPDTLVYLDAEHQYYGPLILTTTEGDTLAPRISGAMSPDSNAIVIDFNEKMDSLSVGMIDKYRLIKSSDTLVTGKIDYILPLDKDFKQLYMRCSGLEAGERYKILAHDLLSGYGIKADTMSRLVEIAETDTTGPQIVTIMPPPSRTPRPSGFDIDFRFTEPMQAQSFDDNISLTDTSDSEIEYSLSWPDSNYVILKPDFTDGETYKLTLTKPGILDINGNPLGDTLEVFYFATAPADTFGQIMGQVVNAPDSNDMYVVAKPKKGDEIKTLAKPDGSFYFARLFPETYNLWAFCDENHNGQYDGGWFRPFRFAEPIAVYADTVDVRARWETDIGKLDFAPSTN